MRAETFAVRQDLGGKKTDVEDAGALLGSPLKVRSVKAQHSKARKNWEGRCQPAPARRWRTAASRSVAGAADTRVAIQTETLRHQRQQLQQEELRRHQKRRRPVKGRMRPDGGGSVTPRALAEGANAPQGTEDVDVVQPGREGTTEQSRVGTAEQAMEGSAGQAMTGTTEQSREGTTQLSRAGTT
ncbi:hypothetical protein FOCC_FOCC016805 [Frankliniella occidentalis]|nr:hypothetical protein FOCC_FOCC016805 [Frankliniella occidentalis]